MGNLIKLPLSEITATLERLEQVGVTPEILKLIRTDFLMARRVANAVLQTPFWHGKDGVIRFNVTSDGTWGEILIKRLEGDGFNVDACAKQMLCSPDFKPTKGLTTEVVVLPGSFFGDNDRRTEKIRAEGALRKLVVPNAELACLIREKFTDKEIEAMGLSFIVAMHKPFFNCTHGPHLLRAHGEGRRWFSASRGEPDVWWGRDGGFAFAVSPQ